MNGAPPERVEAAAVEMGAGSLLVAFLVGAGGSAGDLVPDSCRLIGFDRRSAERSDQQTAHRQGLVPNHLGRQAQSWTPRQETIGRVVLQQGRRELRRLQVGGAGHDHALEGLDVPFQPDQLARQPIEQPGMGGRLSLQAEVLGRRHQSRPEVQLPQSVRRHARGEGMGRVHQPPGQRKTIGRRTRRQRGQDLGDARSHFGARLIVLPASQDEGLPGLVLPHDHGGGDLFPQLPMFGSPTRRTQVYPGPGHEASRWIRSNWR